MLRDSIELFEFSFQKSTMFPAHWSREQVMQSIQEAMKNQHAYALEGMKQIYEGKCAAGFDIRIIIDNGEAKAYPKI